MSAEGIVLVTVGSDHHPFPRLVGWADEWAREHRGVEVVVQHGTAPPPRHATGRPYYPHAELQAHMRRAFAVVTQGGPAGIVEARRHGRMPIVVPRLHDLGEHVDNHQVAYTSFVHAGGEVRLATSAHRMGQLLDQAVDDPSLFDADPCLDAIRIAEAVGRFETIAAGLVDRRRRGARPRRLSARRPTARGGSR